LRNPTPGALVNFGSNGSGVASVGVASGLPLGSNGRVTLTLELKARGEGSVGSINVFRGQIDEQPVDIVSHGTRRSRPR
jgi:hypothetical protein